jgi:hypothetical protein
MTRRIPFHRPRWGSCLGGLKGLRCGTGGKGGNGPTGGALGSYEYWLVWLARLITEEFVVAIESGRLWCENTDGAQVEFVDIVSIVVTEPRSNSIIPLTFLSSCGIGSYA